MEKGVIKWLRWIFAFPISLGLSFLWLFGLEFLLNLILPKSWVPIVDHLIGPFIWTFLSIMGTYIIVPIYKFRAACVVATLWLLIVMSILAISLFRIKLYGEEYVVLDGGVGIGGITVGVAIALIVAWRASLPKANRSQEPEYTF